LSNLIGQIYEAVSVPELWPTILEEIADSVGAFGACFVHRSGENGRWVASPRMEEEMAAAYVAEGWLTRDDRVPPVIAEHYPGFRVDPDYWTEEQVRDMPIYRDFLLPRNLNASAASLIQGSHDDVLHVGIEGLPSYATARAAVPTLDAFRPHLARALSLSAKMTHAHEMGVIRGLDAAGIAAAVVSPSGRLRVSNARFDAWFGGDITDLKGNVQFRDGSATAQLRSALRAPPGSGEAGRSFPIRQAGQVAVAHCIPLSGRSREMFESDGVVVMLAQPGNRMIPSADLLRLLFDLSPAEARLARILAEGRTVTEAAADLGIQVATARSQLKSVFTKTGFSRQVDLVMALSTFGP